MITVGQNFKTTLNHIEAEIRVNYPLNFRGPEKGFRGN